MNNFLVNKLINNISISVKQALEESIGTISLNNVLNNKIDFIIQDLLSEKYISNKIDITDYKDIIQLLDEQNVYLLQYNNISLIEHLDILVVINDEVNYAEAAALLENDNRTIFGENNVLYATIVIYNPINIRFLKTQLYHELRHYYDLFKRETLLFKQDDRDLTYIQNISNKMFIDFLSYKDILMSNILYPSSLSFVSKAFISLLYSLNNKEIYAHNENIFGEIYEYYKNGGLSDNLEDISETYNFYKSIFDIFRYYQTHLDLKTEQYILNKYGTVFYLIYYNKTRNPTSLNFVYKKIFNKLNKFFKHCKLMQLYCKNIFKN